MDRRAEERQWIAASVTFCTRSQASAATAYDISTNGCMLQSGGDLIEVGDSITVQFREFTGIQGKVIWSKHRNAGIEFKVPLPSSVVEKIVREDNVIQSLSLRNGTGDSASKLQRNHATQTPSTLVPQFPLGLVLRTPLEPLAYQLHYGWCVAVLLACAVQLGFFR